MYKLAVLVGGSPRFVKEGSEWWNKIKPTNCEIDLYGHSWSSHDHIGKTRYYKADFDVTPKLFDCWGFKDHTITDHHFDYSLYDYVKTIDPPDGVCGYLFWDIRRDFILSVNEADQLMKKSGKEYDAVVIMRYDTLIRPGALEEMIPYVCDFKDKHSVSFSKGHDKALYWADGRKHSRSDYDVRDMMGDNPQLWVEWVQVRQGLPMIQDFLFCATWKDWNTFTGPKLYDRYWALFNEHYNLVEPALSFVNSKYHPHVFWAYLAFFCNGNFLPDSRLSSVLLRYPKEDITKCSFQSLEDEFNKQFNDLHDRYMEDGEIQGDVKNV